MRCPSCGKENPNDARFCNECGSELDFSIEETEPQQIPSAESSVNADFVGREHEMGELVAVLDAALAGRGRLVTLVGEPGIGKTRTAQELAVIAEQRGAKVWWSSRSPNRERRIVVRRNRPARASGRTEYHCRTRLGSDPGRAPIFLAVLPGRKTPQ